MTRSYEGPACLLALALCASPVTAQSPVPATALRLQQDEAAGTIAVYRGGGRDLPPSERSVSAKSRRYASTTAREQ